MQQTLVSSFCFILLVFSSSIVLGKKPNCGKHGPVIKFPFSFKGHPENSGYPGFLVSCNEKKETILELPNSVKFAIKTIDYEAQKIQLYDPENCLLANLSKVHNMSIFPFHYYSEYHMTNITLFNCSSAERAERESPASSLYSVPCFEERPGYQIYWVYSFYRTEDLPLLSCTKMRNLPSVPYMYETREIYLEWSEPNCGPCEAQGKICGLKNNGNTSTEIECLLMKKGGSGKTLVATGTSLGSFVLVLLAGVAFHAYSSDRKEKQNQLKIERFLEDYRALKPSRYSYSDIKRITDQFKDKLGQGAYGTVYKGELSSECFVAVKVLTSTKGDGEEFVNEVGTMGHIHHVNVVRLVGFCADGFRRALVYDFLPNGSLQDFISSADNNNSFLGWDKLQDIALGIAKGIEYLHQGCDQRILHFDIKPHNVLLDHNFTPKISDFGLAKLCSKDQSIVSMTTARGTMGYIAPEVFSRNFGNVSYKSDVYSYSLSLQCAWVSIVAFLVLGSSGHNGVGASNLKDGAKCVPSSCGDIHNISYPFRLQQDPEQCGDLNYPLECDHNITVLRLFSQEYYVKAINYDNSTIRVVDPGLDKNNCSSLPRFPSRPWTSGSYNGYHIYFTYLYRSDRCVVNPVIFLKCANPVNSSRYVSTAPCINSEMYGYAVQGSISAEDVENGCTVYWMGLTTWMPFEEDRNVSYQDIHYQMVYGFELGYSPFGYPANTDYCGDQWDSHIPYYGRICYPRSIRGFFLSGWNFFTGSFITAGVYWKIIVVSVVGAKLVFGGPFVIALLIHKWRRRHWSTYRTIEDFLHSDNFMPIRYSYSNIKKMSAGFNDKLGAGGYGSVFKCKLRSGHFGAIKLLDKSNANGEDFMSEVATIGRIHHVNVVQLVGYCVEGSKRALVYDFMPNGSLDRYIYSKEESITLSYKKMYEIAVGVAQGIEYLHQGCEMQILHFDIKPHNILLDENFVPKISDFGLAKLYPANNSIVSSMAARGTMGYIAPELFYKNIGGVSYKADVYSFGMLLMEMASRRKNLNANVDHSSQIYFPSWVRDQYNEGKDLEIGDATVEEKKLIRKMIVAALWCIQMKPSDRPSMKRVTQMLVRDVENLEMPPKPSLCPQPTPVSNLIPACSNVELTCTLSAR